MSKQKIFLSFLIFCIFGAILMLMWPQAEKQDEKPAASEVVSTPKDTSERVQPADSSRQNQPVDVWESWVHERTEAMLQYLQNNPESQDLLLDSLDADLLAKLRESFLSENFAFAEVLQQTTDTPPPIDIGFNELFGVTDYNSVEDYNSYEGPQELEALLEKFGDRAADSLLDEKYPQEEWIERTLAQGYTIDSWEDYAGFLTARRNLIGLENAPEVWTSGRLGISPTSDFETYKTAYMDRKIWEYAQLKDAKQVDSRVNGGFFKDDGTFLPFAPQRVYVERVGASAAFIGTSLSDRQKFDLLTRGVSPEGYEIIYIDKDGTRLSGPPPLLSRKDFLTNGN